MYLISDHALLNIKAAIPMQQDHDHLLICLDFYFHSKPSLFPRLSTAINAEVCER